MRVPFRCLGGGLVTCGHYKLHAEASSRERLVWLDMGPAGWVNVWDRLPAKLPTNPAADSVASIEDQVRTVVASEEILVC